MSAELSGVYALRGFLKIHSNWLTCDEFCSGIGLIVDNSTQSPIQSWVVVTCSLSILLVRGDHCVRDWILPTSFPTFPYCPLLRLLPAPPTPSPTAFPITLPSCPYPFPQISLNAIIPLYTYQDRYNMLVAGPCDFSIIIIIREGLLYTKKETNRVLFTC